MPPHPYFTFDFSGLWIAVLIIGAMWLALYLLRKKK
jgi:hypothetical protein